MEVLAYNFTFAIIIFPNKIHSIIKLVIMTIKKYAFFTALLLGAVTGAWAQLGGVHNYMDSNYIPASRMAQQNEWRNNSTSQNFPARPRDQWQLGIYGGYFGIAGDVSPLPGWNAGVSIRKALGYVVSLRGSLSYGQAYGLDYSPEFAFSNLPTTALQKAYSTQGYFINSYKTQVIAPALDALFSLNNIMFHKNKNKFNIYALVGYSPIIYVTNLNLLDSKGAAYNWSGINFSQSRSDVRKQLKNVLDGSYETGAMVKNRDANFGQNKQNVYHIRHGIDFGGGLEYKITKKFSMGLEVKGVFTGSDYLDGKVYQHTNTSTDAPTASSDIPVYTNLSFNFNLGNDKKRTAPLWWLNPLDYLYSETNNPKHTKFPPVVLPDADGDGVTDQFDVEPNTPAGCPVDVHGKSRDTDGDGVPDCRDKELITPTACQPVNADGVGKCPDPQCCKDIMDSMSRMPRQGAGCGIGDLPSVQFKSGSAKLSKDAEAVLTAAAAKIKANPDCKISVVGHGIADKRAQQLSWDHVNAVINFLTEKQNISSARFIFKYGEEGDANTVDLRDAAGDEGAANVPAPHPQYQKK